MFLSISPPACRAFSAECLALGEPIVKYAMSCWNNSGTSTVTLTEINSPDPLRMALDGGSGQDCICARRTPAYGRVLGRAEQGPWNGIALGKV